MSPRNIALLGIAAIIAIGVAISVRNRVQVPETQVAEVAQGRILVAKKDIAIGSFVKSAQDLDWASWPVASVQPTHIKEGAGEDMTTFEGAVARRTIKAGEAITASALIKPGAGGFLSAVLEQGRRAVSIAVSPTSGTAGLIFPGDRVDMIVTHRVKSKPTPDAPETETIVSETFVQDVRVVAVDQMLDNPENKAILAKTVTVEVSPEQAEQVNVASELGKISLSLRSIATDGQGVKPDAQPATGAAATSPHGQDFVSAVSGAPVPPANHRYTMDSKISSVLDRSGEAKPRILVIRGNQNEIREFYQEGQ